MGRKFSGRNDTLESETCMIVSPIKTETPEWQTDKNEPTSVLSHHNGNSYISQREMSFFLGSSNINKWYSEWERFLK